MAAELPHIHGSSTSVGDHFVVETFTPTMENSGVVAPGARLDSLPVLDQITLYIDKVANNMQLGPHHRATLHRFKQVRLTFFI